jgi:hypothetical protein
VARALSPAPPAVPHRCRRVEPPTELVPVDPSTPPALLVLVHTEEEFDWHAPFDRGATATTAIAALDRAQELFAEAGTKPTYVLDYPVATREDCGARFGAWVAAGAAEVGAHLHPWVNPPAEEPVDGWHSFAGNLGPDLERRKLAALTAAIAAGVGVAPTTYLAGRYGRGTATPGLLVELGYTVDTSATPPFDFAAEGGPDYRRFPSRPYRHEGLPSLLGLPVTGAYLGALRRRGAEWFPRLRSPWARRLPLEALASRSRLLERVRLSPEGYELRDLQRLTRRLWADGVRHFTLSLHSTSFVPGHTDYVRDADELRSFERRCRDYCRWFRAEYGGRALSHADVARQLLARSA